jgi:Transposase DDE domain
MEGAMRPGHYTLKSKDVYEHAAELFQTFLGLADHGRKCTAAVVLHVLFYAASRLISICAACQRLAAAPSDQALFKALAATLPAYAELQRRVNRALAGRLPKALRRRAQRLAIDLTLIPYHGEPFADAKEVYRSLAKCGTSHFHAYASVYVVCQGQRFTVALTPVEKGEAMSVVVKRLLRQAAQARVRPRLLLLDRGFYSIDVIRYLHCARVPFLMPAIARGRKPKGGQAATGIRAFQTWKQGGWGQHTLTTTRGAQRRATVSICVYCGNYRGKWKRHGRFAWVYAYWGFQPASTRWVADTYRTRFGIETSYRQMNQARIRTCTRNPLLRFLFVAIALILRNVWVWYHWEVLASPRRGGRLLRLDRLRFETLLVWLLHVAETTLGVSDETSTERPPKPPLKATGECGP